MTKKNKQKLRLYKQNVSLGLIARYKTHHHRIKDVEQIRSTHKLIFSQFKKFHVPLISVFYVNVLSGYWKCSNYITNTGMYNKLQYYAALTKSIEKESTVCITPNQFWSLSNNNILIFSKPKRQLFVLFYKKKPTFIFTGGLMRLVMNEKRKSCTRLYKVAISLIKLAAILLLKRNLFDSCYLRLINIGSIRSKILKSLAVYNSVGVVRYVVIIFRINIGSQKFATRRSIKKYIKKKIVTRASYK